MPNCHRCQHDGKGHADCLACPGPSETPNNQGCTVVEWDAVQNVIELATPDAEQVNPRHERILDFMRSWLRLAPATRDALAMRLTQPELSQAEIGRRIGVTREATRKAIVKADGLVDKRANDKQGVLL